LKGSEFDNPITINHDKWALGEGARERERADLNRTEIPFKLAFYGTI
jgi:hypothetical protein